MSGKTFSVSHLGLFAKFILSLLFSPTFRADEK